MNQKEMDESWAVTEFAEADLNDERRTQRLVEIATVLAQQPGASFPEACSDRAMLKATYRFFDNEAIEPEAILGSHEEATRSRLAEMPLVLAVQDTTELDWTHHPATQGLGPLSGAEQQGLLVHTTLAITPERVPLGVIDQQVWARDPEPVGKRQERKQRPIEQKESQKWLNSLRAVIEASQECPETHFVSVGDREADVYDLFLVERPTNVDLLIRAAWDRRVEHEEKYLWAHVEAQPAAATVEVDVAKRGDQPARRATVQVRFAPVTLRPPRHRQAEHLPMMEIWAVQAVETHPPVGVEPIEWLLLTTCPVETVEQALERLDWYAGRWGIEVFHKVLKSGCRIEARQLETADRLRRCLSVFSVIAWRIMYAAMLSRVLPDAPCTAILEPEEWQALYCRLHQTPTLPEQVPTLREAVHWIARLGGFLDRPGDGEPGVTVLWKGFQHLRDLTAMYHIFRPTRPKRKNVGKG
jgi:hypothetical protein